MFDAPREEPFTAVAAEGHVLLDGPRIAVTLRPADAVSVAEQLIIAAAEAVGQQPNP